MSELLPFYLNGTLAERRRAEVAAHLRTCPACQRELAMWRSVRAAMAQEAQGWAQAVPPAAGLLRHLAARGGAGVSRAAGEHPAARPPAAGVAAAAWRVLCRAALLVAAQARVVPRAVWLSTPALLAAGVLAQAAAGDLLALRHLVELLAPVVVAIAVVAAVDLPAAGRMELVAVTPTSPRLLLWASLTGQFTYHAAVLLLGSWVAPPTPGPWDLAFFARHILAPTAAVSAAALLASVLAGNAAGTATACVLELTFLASRAEQAAPRIPLPALDPVLAIWGSSAALWAVTAVLFAALFWLADRAVPRRTLSV